MILEDVSVLISTMNNVVPKFFIKNKGLSVVVNQTKDDDFFSEEHGWIKSNQIGLSKSRNLAIKNAKTKFCCISDNDVYYINNYDELIVKYFNQYPNADILLFQIKDDCDIPYKKYKDKVYKVGFFDVLKFSSIEIVFRRESIIANNIVFDERFGLGALYKCGEENIFLLDCLKAGLNIYSINVPLVIHPLESSGKIIDDSYFYCRGAVFTRLYGFVIAFLIFIIFCFKKTNNYKNLFHNFILMVKGCIDFMSNKV
ncbi:glycosyltransferase family A protein [Acinetobacter sp. YH16037]|uniref:glycosyltransferase family A protein n=1 Tax=Acinetobacter sp. YH16037 TaxID=2601182 RepID=UPI0015D1CB99|nr:glycosyltransferase family A protein [Acinetobacter sp. YH16037]